MLVKVEHNPDLLIRPIDEEALYFVSHTFADSPQDDTHTWLTEQELIERYDFLKRAILLSYPEDHFRLVLTAGLVQIEVEKQ